MQVKARCLQKKECMKWMPRLWTEAPCDAGAIAGVRNIRNPVELADRSYAAQRACFFKWQRSQ